MKFLISTICLLFFSFVIQAQNDQLELEWAHSFSSDRWDAATSVRADNSGNVVVAGFFSDAMDFDPGPGEFILSPVGDDNQAELSNVNGYLQKLDGDGNLLWAISHLAGDFPACCVLPEQKTSVYIAPNDDIFVLSNVNNSIDLDPGPGIINFGEAITQEWVIQKFSPDGELIWVKTTNLTENNGKATCLSIDNEGNLFLGGLYNAFYCLNLGTGCSAVSPFYSSGNLPFISKLNGSTGDLIWSRIFEGISQFIDQQTIDSDVLDIAIDPSTGNATIAGWFIGALQISPGVFWNWAGNSDGQKGYLITMNGSDGQTIWAEQFNEDPQFDLYIQDVAYDGMSRLYARGRFPQENGFGYNDRTVIYDSQGAVLQYIYQDPSAQRERNTILHVNPDGSFLLSGMLSDTAFGRERHKANIYNTSWQLEVQHQFFGPFYIYSTHWANAAFNSNGEVFFAGGYSQSDYDADASADGEFILPIGDCNWQVCSEAFVQKVAACPGTNSFEAVSICAGSSYTFPDGTTIENIQSDLEYVSNLGIVDGCENTITTTLTVQVPYFNTTDNYVCSGESFTMPDGGVWVINESISQTFNYFTSSGCDSTIVVNIFVESPPSLTASYDCLNDQLLVNITDMGTFQGQTSPPWNMTALGLEPSETITIEGPGLYIFPGANPNQSYRLALFEPNNCAPDYSIFPNCYEAPCGDSALEQIDNGNFDLENDNSWTQSSTLLDGTSPTGYDVIDATFIYDNSPLSAWFGGFNSGSITSIQQDIYLPSSTEITNLTWWERYNGACSSEDVFTISLAGEIIYQQVSADEPNCGSPVWHRKSIDISSFATGTTLELTLSYVQTGTNGYSSLFLDNLSVLSCPCSPQIENQTVQVCYGGSYTFPDGTTIENIQSDLEYVSNLGIIDGCETTITTTLTVQVPYFNATDNYLCSGESFTMPDGGVWVINESISQTFNYFTSSGCDSTIVVNIFVESPPSLTASYDCLNDQLLVNITDMGTFQGQTSPPWNMTALGLEPSETIIIEGPGLYTFPGANPNQSYRLALFEPNNCAPDYFIYPNCNEAPCGDSALEQIDNGNFDLENDNSWTQSSTLLDGTSPTGYDVIDATFIYDNSPLSAWFGGFNSGSITSIQQDIYLPSSTEITNLTWWERYNGACSSEDVFTISLAGEIIYQQVSADEPNCGSPVWHRKSIDISSFATGTNLELTLSYVQTGTNGYSSLFLDNLSVLSCPCSPQIENQTVQVCYGGSYTFPNGATIDNITEGFDQYSYFSPPPCLTGIITTVEIIPAGCTDPSACNFDPTVACDDGSCCSCEADFNGDGSTNTTDLIILIEDYGCNLNCGNSDMNNDGSVNSADVLIFLNSFGSSCF